MGLVVISPNTLPQMVETSFSRLSLQIRLKPSIGSRPAIHDNEN